METCRESIRVIIDKDVSGSTAYVVSRTFYQKHEGERKRHTDFYACGTRQAAGRLVEALVR